VFSFLGFITRFGLPGVVVGASSIQQFFSPLAPIKNLWWLIFGVSIGWGLLHIYAALESVAVFRAIGAYGLAIIAITIIVKTILWPLYHYQIQATKRSLEQSRKLAPEIAKIRKKHKGNPQKIQEETLKLYKEYGVSPFSAMSGCLPAIAQFPVLVALYYLLFGIAHSHNVLSVAGSTIHIKSARFLWIPNLNQSAAQHLLSASIPFIPVPAYIVIPILAALTTYIQTKMMQQPLPPDATEQERQQQQMTQSMQFMMPLIILYFAYIMPAGLGLYWVVSNLVTIGQQYFATGWGGLRLARRET